MLLNMNTTNLLTIGSAAGLLESCHRRFAEPFVNTNHYKLVAFPQHIVAACIASTYFNHYTSWAIFFGLPLTCLAVVVFAQKGSKLSKIGDAVDHLSRLASKVMIITAAFKELFSAPPFTSTQAKTILITCSLFNSLIRDTVVTALGAISGMSFEEIFLVQKKIPLGQMIKMIWIRIQTM